MPKKRRPRPTQAEVFPYSQKAGGEPQGAPTLVPSESGSQWPARQRRPGKAGKGPLPKLPGRVLYRAAADRRNTTRRPHGRVAGIRTEPAGAPPPHSCKGLTVLVAGSEHLGWRRHRSRPCAQIRSRFCPRAWSGAQTCAGRHPRQSAAASRNGKYARTGQSARTAADGLPTAASSGGSQAPSSPGPCCSASGSSCWTKPPPHWMLR